MNKLGIPANADNKVVAGENAKAMTKEFLEGLKKERLVKPDSYAASETLYSPL
mgnify:CR=1 FL=1